MNKDRRKRLSDVFDKCAEIIEIVEQVRDEEYESRENLPDSFRDGEKGEEMQGYIEMLDEVSGYLMDAQSVIEQI